MCQNDTFKCWKLELIWIFSLTIKSMPSIEAVQDWGLKINEKRVWWDFIDHSFNVAIILAARKTILLEYVYVQDNNLNVILYNELEGPTRLNPMTNLASIVTYWQVSKYQIWDIQVYRLYKLGLAHNCVPKAHLKCAYSKNYAKELIEHNHKTRCLRYLQ